MSERIENGGAPDGGDGDGVAERDDLRRIVKGLGWEDPAESLLATATKAAECGEWLDVLEHVRHLRLCILDEQLQREVLLLALSAAVATGDEEIVADVESEVGDRVRLPGHSVKRFLSVLGGVEAANEELRVRVVGWVAAAAAPEVEEGDDGGVDEDAGLLAGAEEPRPALWFIPPMDCGDDGEQVGSGLYDWAQDVGGEAEMAREEATEEMLPEKEGNALVAVDDADAGSAVVAASAGRVRNPFDKTPGIATGVEEVVIGGMADLEDLVFETPADDTDAEDVVVQLIGRVRERMGGNLDAEELEAYFDLGLTFLHMEQWTQAIAVLEEVGRDGKYRLSAFEGIVRALLGSGDLDKADWYVGRMLGFYSEDALIHYWMGRVAEGRGEMEIALGAYTRAQEIDPMLPDVAEGCARCQF